MILNKLISSVNGKFHNRTTHPDSLATRDLTLHDSVSIFDLCTQNFVATVACIEIKSFGLVKTLPSRTNLWTVWRGKIGC